jgi:hypothetical protein
MNDKQRRVLWTGIIVVVVMGIFPPIVGSYSPQSTVGHYFHPSTGYDFLLTASSATFTGNLHWKNANFVKKNNHLNWIEVIDFQKLLIQWSIVAAIAAGAIVSNRRTNDKPKE